ncbi:MAG: class I SAM-dependent methyltransferase [Pseudomonadota bacterium]|nr:class I SAM-dependent methyltransferase [Pseudomonadota bacterium]
MKNKLDQSFGYQRVTTDERQQRIRSVFDAVAPRYDLMNDTMSFGIHRLWKRALARMANPQPGQVVVDLAGGTGDVASKMSAAGRRTIIVDPSLAMMEQGRAGNPSEIEYVASSGETLALADDSADTLTIAFGMRNMTRMDTALAEILRILKPGGRCLCLEFSKPHALIKPFYDLHSFHVIPRLGAWIARQPMAYNYLVESIRKFPDQEEMKKLMEQTGFRNVNYRNLSFGIACIHEGTKP